MRSSLGQMANIGDLYDARTDRFTGQSVVTDSTGSLAVSSMPMESYREEFLTNATFYDRLALLVNDKELQLSVLLRLVVPDPNVGAFIGQDDINFSPTNGILLRTAKILREQVGSIADIKHLVSSYQSGNATHVVVGVEWGATVAICLDHSDRDVPSEQTVDVNLQQQLQMLISSLKSGARPNPQVVSDISGTYTIRCFSNGLPHGNQPSSLEDAIALMSDLPRLIQSVNNGKGAPVSFVLVPLSSLTERTMSLPSRVEQSVFTQALKLFREVKITKHNFYSLSQYLKDRNGYLQKPEMDKIYEFLTGFEQAEKKLYNDVINAVAAVRSGDRDQSRLANILRDFSGGCYCVDNIKAFLDTIKPTLQKIQFLDEVTNEGIVIIGDSQTSLHDIMCNPDVYILYATESAKQQNPRLWEENSSAFLGIVREEKRKHVRTSGNTNAAMFAYIDYDIVRGAHIDKGIAIHRYNQGNHVSHNVAEERAVTASLNIASCSQKKKKQLFAARPVKRALVELPCPDTSSKCGSNLRIWSCDVCKEQMEYGFDDNFYCPCGRAPVRTFSYKCNEVSHGHDFLTFQPHVIQEHVRNMKPIREINILFLGETGVGKSTWINGLANYISYSTLSEAENSENVCVIPTKFTMTDEKLEEVEIRTGSDSNENHQVGRSSTQMPKSYKFRYRGTHIRIIDTPGIGDTRGLKYDRTNFQHIMTHLSKYDEINGICILLKPNNSRLTVMFQFCIKELLTHLHRDACRNIVFCFTNARGTFYKPGDTLPPLRELIANSNIDLHLTMKTVYCIDNESVRFLAALKQRIDFKEEEKKNYSTSWEISVKETERLIEYISSLPPHKGKNTLSLNDSRRLIVELSRPLAEISSTIQNNIGAVEQRRKEVLEWEKDKQDLTNVLYIPVIDLQTPPLDYPRTVCTSSRCVKHISVGDIKKIDYCSHCHPHCYLGNVETNTVNCAALQNCEAMNYESHNCLHCGCSWSVHMHITYECIQFETQIVDRNVERQIKDKASRIEIIQEHLQSLEDRIKALEAEKRNVVRVSAEFACFLKHNAIAPFNDSISDYLDHLIRVEQGIVAAGGGDRRKLLGLESMKAMHEEEVKILEKAINDSKGRKSVPSAEGIKRLYDDLCRLPIAGPMLKGAMRVAETASQGAMQKNEKIIQAHPKPQRTNKGAAVAEPLRNVLAKIKIFWLDLF